MNGIHETFSRPVFLAGPRSHLSSNADGTDARALPKLAGPGGTTIELGNPDKDEEGVMAAVQAVESGLVDSPEVCGQWPFWSPQTVTARETTRVIASGQHVILGSHYSVA